MGRERIGLKHINSIGQNSIIWDRTVTGFGIRRQRSDAVIYFVFYRTKDGRQRWQKIGRHGNGWDCDKAREQARQRFWARLRTAPIRPACGSSIATRP